jgi:hypothetical protein
MTLSTSAVANEPIEASEAEYERYLRSLVEISDESESLPEYFVPQAAPLSLTLR